MNTGRNSSVPLSTPAAEPEPQPIIFCAGLLHATDRQTAEFLCELRQELQSLRQIAPGKLQSDGQSAVSEKHAGLFVAAGIRLPQNEVVKLPTIFYPADWTKSKNGCIIRHG